MIKAISLPAKQIELLSKAQDVANRAQADVTLIAQTVLLGLGIDGKIVEIDPSKGTVNVEVKDEEAS